MCDTRGGTTANFLHTSARQDKSGTLRRGERDCADNPLDKLPTGNRKLLSPDGLSERLEAALDMLMDVNKRMRSGGRNCVSPIHGH
ncbi:hypothetical protein XH96_01035 [Bradyrhizobium sp. CCBAU 51765]|nr:hypothetical protein XH96_01035 [Bradyrhizobium sp. CCBAU 51765]